jgi:flagellin-like protein
MMRLKAKTTKTKIKRSIRAISPVIATLMMIAIAVAASLVAYAWVMGYIGGTTAKTGKAVQVQSMSIDPSDDKLLVYVQNVGQGAVTISSVYVNDLQKDFTTDKVGNKINEGETATVTVDYIVAVGEKVKVKVVTTDGTFTESTNSNLNIGGGGGGSTPALDHFDFNNINSPQIAGMSFGITITAKDQFDALFSYSGSGTLSDLTGTISYPAGCTFVNGVANPSVTITTARAGDTITVNAGGKSGTSGSFDVNAGAINKFAVVAPASVAVGETFTLTVTAQDAYSNTIASYSSSVGLSISGTGSTMNPTSTGTTGWTNGVWTSSSVTVSATAGSGYTITANDGSGHTGTSNSFTVNPPAPVTIQFRTSGVDSDAGTKTIITVDSTPYTYAQLQTLSFSWTPGSTHTIAAMSPVSAGTDKQYAWTSWSDLGTQSHDYITPGSAATVTVNYGIQYRLTMTTNFGTTSPAVGTSWVDAGSSVTIYAVMTNGTSDRYIWAGWTGSGTGSYSGTGNNSALITMNGAITESASWTQQYKLTMATNFGTTSPVAGDSWYNAGSSVTIYAVMTNGTNERYIWAGWTGTGTGSYSGAGNNSVLVTMNGAITESASWTHQYKLTMATNFGTTSPAAGDSWYTAGSTVTIYAVMTNGTNGYFWAGWTGTGTGSYTGTGNNSALVTMNGVITETASWTQLTFGIDSNCIGFGSATDPSTTITTSSMTAQSGELIILIITQGNTGSSSLRTVTSISDSFSSGNHLAWTQRVISSGNAYGSGADALGISEYYAITASSQTGAFTITVTMSDNNRDFDVLALGITGAKTSSPFDSNYPTPNTHRTSGTSSGTPTVTGITTANANDLILAFEGDVSSTAQSVGTIAGSTPSGSSLHNVNSQGCNAEYIITTSTVSGSATFGTAKPNWVMIVDAVQRAW